MGGNDYDRPIPKTSSAGSFSNGSTSSADANRALGRNGAHASTSPKKRTVTSNSKSPIVIGLDVTGSNTEFARIVYDKAPMLYGQIQQQKYLKDFDICFSAIGDAYTDDAPLQVCNFQSGIKLDTELQKIFLEGGGGGQGMETYELAAYFFANHCDMPNAELPFLFMIGDEAPYSKLESHIARKVLGNEMSADLTTEKIFQDVYRKFQGNVYFLQNPYSGNISESRATREINDKWQGYVGRENKKNIISIHEEKSVVDVILGIIAIVSGSKNLSGYSNDLSVRQQTSKRIKNVTMSLENLETTLVPYSKVHLPAISGKGKFCGGKRI